MKKLFKNGTIIISAMVITSFMLFAFTPGYQNPWNVPAKYKSMKNTVTSDSKSVEAGKVIYEKQCKACHGVKGIGKGSIRSFASKEYKAQKPGEKYYESFVGGGKMPNFEKKITSETDRWSVINYIETF